MMLLENGSFIEGEILGVGVECVELAQNAMNRRAPKVGFDVIDDDTH
jgi:hypothetical protein